jgi:hypothetical protein
MIDVRCWRHEVYEERRGLSLKERQKQDRELLESLGLVDRVVRPREQPRPGADDRRIAG